MVRRLRTVFLSRGAAAAPLCLVFLAAACAASRQAEWSETREDSRYLYVPGVATSAPSLEEGKRRAVNNAIGEVIPYFGYASRVQYDEQRTELATRVLDEFAATSRGAHVKESLLHKWRYEQNEARGTYDVFVIVRFSRQWVQEEKARFRREDAERSFLVHQALEEARAAEQRGEVRTALARYVEALRLTGKAEGGQSGRTWHDQAASGLRSLASRLRLEAVSGNGQRGELFGALAQPLAVRATLGAGRGDREGAVPVLDLPLIFALAEGRARVVPAGRTDAHGLVSARVEQIEAVGESNRIRVHPDVERLLPSASGLTGEDAAALSEAAGILRGSEIAFVFSSRVDRERLVLVSVEEANLGEACQDSIVKGEISNRLLAAGFRVQAEPPAAWAGPYAPAPDPSAAAGQSSGAPAPEADFLVAARAATRATGPSVHGMKCSLADVFLQVTSRRHGSLLVEKQEVGVRGLARTEEEAGIQALRNAAAICAEAVVQGLLQAAVDQTEERETHELCH